MNNFTIQLDLLQELVQSLPQEYQSQLLPIVEQLRVLSIDNITDDMSNNKSLELEFQNTKIVIKDYLVTDLSLTDTSNIIFRDYTGQRRGYYELNLSLICHTLNKYPKDDDTP